MKEAVKSNITTPHLNFISYLRIFGTVSILFCHIVQINDNPYVALTAQVFNIGVQLFMVISGFCFGLQGEITQIKKWYLKRIRRIYIPYEIFLAVLFIIYIIRCREIVVKDWVFYILGMHSSHFDILGADHTWFVTALIMCYIFTPAISKWCTKIEKISKKFKVVSVLAFALFYLLICFNPYEAVFVVFSPLFFYASAYFLGRNYQHISEKARLIPYALIGILLAGISRVLLKFVFDSTMFYSRFIVSLTQYIIAFSILLLFSRVFRNAKNGKLVKAATSVCFEIYLCHYMFIMGPANVGVFVPGFAGKVIVILISCIVTSIIIHILSVLVEKMLSNLSRKV